MKKPMYFFISCILAFSFASGMAFADYLSPGGSNNRLTTTQRMPANAPIMKNNFTTHSEFAPAATWLIGTALLGFVVVQRRRHSKDLDF
ncbi:MAG: hypothetical protein V3W04_14605 [Gammaproteobacteria bacterium]